MVGREGGDHRTSSTSTSSMISKGDTGRRRGSTSSTATGLYLKQLRALLWKSFITRRVHYISTFFELIGPVLLPLFLVVIYSNINSSSETSNGHHVDMDSTSSTTGPVYAGPDTFPTFMDLNFNEIDFRRKDHKKTEVLYAPNTPEAARMVASLRQSNVKVYGLATEALVQEVLDKRIQNDTERELAADFPLLGLVFDEVSPATGQLRYRILVPSSKNFNSQTGLKYPIKMNQRPAEPNYFEYLEFTRVSAHVNREYLREACTVHQNGPQCDHLISRLSFTRMPYPRYQEPENSKFNVYDAVGLIIVLGYVLVVPLIVKRITDEKDGKVKEMLRMIGMSDLVFWSAHFVSFFVILVVQAAIFAYLFFLMDEPIVQQSSITFFFAFFLCYGAQLILFAMLITTIFNRPVIAVVATTILWIVASALIFRFQVPSIAQSGNVEAGNFGRLLTSFTPCGSLIFYFSILGDLENKGTGLGWTNMATRQTIYGNFSVLIVLLCILLSCLLYAFLIFYLDNVWPFQHGVPRSPFFICDPSYWRPKSPSSRPQSGRAAPHLNPTKYEPDPDNLNARIMVQDLCKSFSSKFSSAKKPAVDHLWLNIYENQLTVLLGHNGAGKTTTMSMICGMFPSSSGCIYVNGYNVFTQTNQARRSIGLCPQENIYFNELTVGQHLRLFALLKDFSSENVNKEVNYVLEMLALKDKKNVLASSLSGGMKRKLALGIALIGDTETLILDEPTSGMDPEARRVIWDLLISLRRQRTILLTTHYMEEADVLADRIAILNDGHLVCSGSGLFLKNAFGTGYRLRVAKAASPTAAATAHFDSRRFEAILRKYVPAAKLVSEVETEVVYSLEEEKETLMTTFPALFNDIEQHRENYGIDCCGLSYATLEDVFLKVGSDLQLANGNGEEGAHDDTENGAANGELLLCKPGELTTGGTLFGSQFVGLLLKRLHYARRSPLMVILQLLIPGAIIALALYVDGKIRAGSERYTLPMNVEAIYGPDTKTWFYESAEGGGGGYTAASYYNNYLDLNTRKYGADVYKVPSAPSALMANEAINRWILGRANESFSEYLHSYLYGVEVERPATPADGGIFNLWFNNEQFHSLPLAVVTFFESLLRALLPEALKDRLAISITSVPVSSQSSTELFNMLFIVMSWILTCLIFLPIAFPFLAASYVLYPIKEQASKAKLIQLMTGLSPALFWSVNFLFDLLNHLLATGVLFFIIYLLDSNSSMFGSGEQNSAPALFLLILSFGVATIPVVYAFSFFFTSPPSGYVFVVILYLVFGLIGNIIFSVFHICNNFFAMNVGGSWAESALWLFRAVPIFSMLFGYQKIYLLSVMSSVCRSNNIDQMCGSFTNETSRMMLGCCPGKCGDHCFSQASAFSFSSIGAGTELASLFLSGLIFFLLIVVYESQRGRIWRLFTMGLPCGIGRGRGGGGSSHSQSTKVMLLSGDSDVEREVARVEEEVANRRHMTDLLTVHKLKKDFGGFTAVDEISFGVKYDEVFGFLGVNGAGKTTTFSLLTGELMPTSGNAYIKKGQFALTEDMQQFQKCIGLCPQFDALSPQLSGEEMLYLFGRLRGVPKASLARDVENLVKMVGLEKHYANVSETYSGGNRRKLSLAIALIGSPSLIFLDEPSAGVDPAARRKIWQALGYVKRSLKSSVVLTSHSMEECEALCSRIAIMVNGKFRCLGSTQHLRSKYGQGYSVAIRLKREHESDTVYFTEIQVAMGRVLPSAVLKDCHQCLLHYHITDTAQTWSNIFTQMNALNETFHFEDYFVSDTTLEAIFIMFARHQQTQAV